MKQTPDIRPHEYCGETWLDARLPSARQDWRASGKHSMLVDDRKGFEQHMGQLNWQWPSCDVVFISDVHADADAFLAALVASGGIEKTGAADTQFHLTTKGRAAHFIMGGDFFDKGPSNLRVLRVLRLLIDCGASIDLLAGNHDIRVLYGMGSVGKKHEPHSTHFFVRMGGKAVSFLKELRDDYLSHPAALDGIPDQATCKKLLFPSEAWWEDFPARVATFISPLAVKREMKKIRNKTSRFENLCGKSGLSLREVYAAALKWQALFLSPSGEFHWFFDIMRLASHKGSFLFVHAGLDDNVAGMISKHGVTFVNQSFKKELLANAFEFYYGPIANTIRTKYRAVDMPFTERGSQQLGDAGITAIVHGHRNLHFGQRIVFRKNILHFECDITLDSGTRRREGLKGCGAGATIFSPDGYALGISSDYKKIKVFQPG
ncbi:MAG: hypothetical protein ACI9Y1_000682 [Lentisphaeria bacterium]